MKTLFKLLRKLRITVAAIVFLAISAQFLDLYHRLPKPYYMLNPTGTQFTPSLLEMLATFGVLAGAAFIAFTLLALVCGRAYCSFFCVFGILMDIIARAKKVFSKKKIGNFKFRRARNGLRYTFLALAIIAIATGYTSLLGLIEPYSLYGKIMGNVVHPALAYAFGSASQTLYSVGIYSVPPIDGTPAVALAAFGFSLAVLIAISIASMIRGRIYCNTLCPVGAFLGIFARFSIFKISFDKSKCIGCKICERECKAECIDVKNRYVDFSKCVLCFNCTAKCPKGAISLKLNGADKKESAAKCDVKKTATQSAPNGQQKSSMTRRAFPQAALALGGLLCMAAKKDADIGTREGGKKGLGLGRGDGKGLGLGKGENCTYEVSADASEYRLNGARPDKRLPAPPGAKSLENYLEHCTGCQICTAACKAQILKPSITEWGLSGFMQPFMDYTVGFCLYDCHNCTKACPTGAISFLTKEQKRTEKIGTAIFKKRLCVVHTDGTDCAACAEHCPVQAIEMLPFGKKEDSLYIPHIHDEVCIGCGACEYICPVTPHKAIVVQGIKKHRKAVVFEESMRLFKPEESVKKTPPTNADDKKTSDSKPSGADLFPF